MQTMVSFQRRRGSLTMFGFSQCVDGLEGGDLQMDAHTNAPSADP